MASEIIVEVQAIDPLTEADISVTVEESTTPGYESDLVIASPALPDPENILITVVTSTTAGQATTTTPLSQLLGIRGRGRSRISTVQSGHPTLDVEEVRLSGSSVMPAFTSTGAIHVDTSTPGDNALTAPPETTWSTAGGNVERTSYVATGGPSVGMLREGSARPFEPLISRRVQHVGGDVPGVGPLVFLAHSNGVTALTADEAQTPVWHYATELPIAHSVTYSDGFVYAGGLDRKLHVINAATGVKHVTTQVAGQICVNPMVVRDSLGPLVFFGDRYGDFYCVYGANYPGGLQGEIKWTWQGTHGHPILYSASFRNDGDLVYFGCQDGRLHCLNGLTGVQAWQSDVIPGQGFRSYYPVVLPDGAVLMTRRAERSPEINEHNSVLFPTSPPTGSLAGTLIPAGGGQHAKLDIHPNPFGTSIVEYLNTNPLRATVFIYDGADGTPELYNLRGSGAVDPVPFMWCGEPSINRVPPVVGPDGIIYSQATVHRAGGIPGAIPVGWDRSAPGEYLLVVDRYNQQSGFFPQDETTGLSRVGDMLIWHLITDRFMGWADLSQPCNYSQSATGLSSTNPNISPRQWRLMNGRQGPNDTPSLPNDTANPPGIPPYGTSLGDYWWGLTQANGGYGYGWNSLWTTTLDSRSAPATALTNYFIDHGDKAAPVAFNGRLWTINGNASIVWSPTGLGVNAPVHAPVMIVSGDVEPGTTLDIATLRQRLNDYVEATVTAAMSAGGLKSGYFQYGNWTSVQAGALDDDTDTWRRPGDNLEVFLRVLPFLDQDVREATEAFIQAEYQPVEPDGRVNPVDFRHVGFTVGALRDTWTMYSRPTSAPSAGFWGEAAYAIWKWSQAFPGSEQEAYDEVKTRTVVPPALTYVDTLTGTQPANYLVYQWCRYVTYCYGYLGLWRDAGEDPDTKVTDPATGINVLLPQYLAAIAAAPWNPVYTPNSSQNSGAPLYYAVGNQGWFAYKMPEELAAYLRENALAHVASIIDRHKKMAPLWPEPHNPDTQLENGMMLYHQHHKLFQASAKILQSSQDYLLKHLSDPETPIGDIWWMDNVAAVLEASPVSDVEFMATVAQGGMWEAWFDVATTADNPFQDYRSTYPPGVVTTGITVDGEFSDDGFVTYIRQPARYGVLTTAKLAAGLGAVAVPTQKDGLDWNPPSDTAKWQLCFEPPRAGDWQVRIRTIDASGESLTGAMSFEAMPATVRGPLRIATDPRYLKTNTDGLTFHGVGHNMTSDIDGNADDTDANAAFFATWGANNIEFMRFWMLSWGAWGGAAWNSWTSSTPFWSTQNEPQTHVYPRSHQRFLPGNEYPGLEPPAMPAGEDYFFWLNGDRTVFGGGQQFRWDPIRYLGGNNAPRIPIERGATYRLEVSYAERGLEGPQAPGNPYGMAIKVADSVLWHNSNETLRAYYPGTGTVLCASYPGAGWSNAADPDAPGWTLGVGSLGPSFTNTRDFIHTFYMVIENVLSTTADAKAGHVYIRRISLRKDLGGGAYGPELIYRSSPNAHRYVSAERAYGLETLLAQARANGIYVMPVVFDKSDSTMHYLNHDGTQAGIRTETLFYGNGRELAGESPNRYWQRCWKRYVQAAYGWSSYWGVEQLLNEGGTDAAHMTLADEMGKFSKWQIFGLAVGSALPENAPLCTTSFGSVVSLPFTDSEYPYATDIITQHSYVSTTTTDRSAQVKSDARFYGTVADHIAAANVHSGDGKPVFRDETGHNPPATMGTEPFHLNAIVARKHLHQQLWSSLYDVAMMPHYWGNHPQRSHFDKRVGQPTGSVLTWSHEDLWKDLADYLANVNLGAGGWVAHGATPPANTFVLGQKRTASNQAILSVIHEKDNWPAYATEQGLDVNVPTTPAWDSSELSGTITLTGFSPSTSIPIEVWEYTRPVVLAVSQKSRMTNGSGDLVLDLADRTLIAATTTVVAFKIGAYP